MLQPAATGGSYDKWPIVDSAALEQQPQQPRWYSPRRLLALFSVILFISWADIGSIASNGVSGTRPSDGVAGTGLRGRFDLNDLQLGLLPALYSLGLLLASFAFSGLAERWSAFRLIGVGSVVWTLGVLLTGAAPNYGVLLFARIIVGAGEASIMTLSWPFVDDTAPPARKSFWFATLACFPVVGVAAGYIAGGAIADAAGWRRVFYLEAILGVPIALFCLLAPPVDLRGTTALQQQQQQLHQQPSLETATCGPVAGGGAGVGAPTALGTDGADAGPAKVFPSCADGGLAPGTDAVAPGPSCAQPQLQPRPALSDDACWAEEQRSASAASCGVGGRSSSCQGPRPGLSGGSVAGGRACDGGGGDRWWSGAVVLWRHPAVLLNNVGYAPIQGVIGFFTFFMPKMGVDMFGVSQSEADLVFGAITVVTGIVGTLVGGVLFDRIGSSLLNGFRLQFACSVAALLFIELAFLACAGFAAFCAVTGLALLAMFATSGASYGMSMWAVPLAARPLSQATLIMLMHLLGDVPSPVLAGLMHDRLDTWHVVGAVEGAYLVVSIALYGAGMFVASRPGCVDYRQDEAQESAMESGRRGLLTAVVPVAAASRGV